MTALLYSAGTCKANLPSASVEVPSEVPLIYTFAPGKDAPVLSETLPRTKRCA